MTKKLPLTVTSSAASTSASVTSSNGFATNPVACGVDDDVEPAERVGRTFDDGPRAGGLREVAVAASRRERRRQPSARGAPDDAGAELAGAAGDERPAPACLLEPLSHRVPVDDVPPRREVVRAAVLVVEVVGVLPDVDAEERHLALHQRRVLVRRRLDGEPAAVGDEPRPAAAEALDAGVVDLSFMLDAAERADRLSEAARLAAAVRAHDLPEERVVRVAAGVVADGRPLVLGQRVEVGQDLLDGRSAPACPRAPCSRCPRRPGGACRGGSPSCVRRSSARALRGRRAGRVRAQMAWCTLLVRGAEEGYAPRRPAGRYVESGGTNVELRGDQAARELKPRSSSSTASRGRRSRRTTSSTRATWTSGTRSSASSRTADLGSANQVFSDFRALKVELSFAVGGIKNHEVYFEHLGGDGGEPARADRAT